MANSGANFKANSGAPFRPSPQTQRLMGQAVAHHQAGRLAEAEGIYRQVLQIEPRNPDALHLLGLVHFHNKRYADALPLIGQALKLKPGQAEFHTSLGQVHAALRQFARAAECHGRAVQLDPKLPQAWTNLGAALHELDRLEEAQAAAKKAVELDGRDSSAMGAALGALGNIEKDLGHHDLAVTLLRQALALRPNHAYTLSNLGDALRAVGAWDEARGMLERAVALEPGMAEAHWNLSMVLLGLGDWRAGWAEYEWRLRVPRHVMRRPTTPRWDGSGQTDKTLLLWSEQGFGDCIQFLRYAGVAAKKCRQVILECPEPLARLAAGVEGVSRVESGPRAPSPLAALESGHESSRREIDAKASSPYPAETTGGHGEGEKAGLQAPLLSLPFLLGTGGDFLGGSVPYLRADAALISDWRGRLDRASARQGVSGRLVGLVWGGNEKPDPRRSATLADMAPLGRLAGVTFVSLQLGSHAAQTQSPPAGMRLIDLTGYITDFADTAALIANLDAVITIDSAAAHLAGAMGTRTYTLLPYVADWRWGSAGDRSGWYPTMRLFRQDRAADWSGAIDAAAASLSQDIL